MSRAWTRRMAHLAGALLVLLVVAAAALLLFGHTALGAQEFRAGIASHGTGSEEHCSAARAVALGVSAETDGPWITRAGLDVFTTWGMSCDDILPVATYRGEMVEVWGTTELTLAPRLSAHLGRSFRLGPLVAELSVGAGAMRTVTDIGAHGGDPGSVRYPIREATWQPWYGGTLGVGPLPGDLRMEVEVGRHRLLRRYYGMEGDLLVREFGLQRDFVRIGLALAL